MARMIQIRNVPDETHRALKERAERAGMTLSGYLLREVSQVLEQPPLDELYARIRRRRRSRASFDSAAVIRAIRQKR